MSVIIKEKNTIRMCDETLCAHEAVARVRLRKASERKALIETNCCKEYLEKIEVAHKARSKGWPVIVLTVVHFR
jgi:hypothetical protein